MSTIEAKALTELRIKEAQERARGMGIPLGKGLVAVPLVGHSNKPQFRDGEQIYVLPGGLEVLANELVKYQQF